MASSKDYLDFVLEQLSELDEVSSRAMMGEYALVECKYTEDWELNQKRSVAKHFTEQWEVTWQVILSKKC